MTRHAICLRGRNVFYIAAILLIGLRATAEAAVIGTMTLMRDPTIGVPFTSPDAALPAPWASYALGLRTTAGE